MSKLIWASPLITWQKYNASHDDTLKVTRPDQCLHSQISIGENVIFVMQLYENKPNKHKRHVYKSKDEALKNIFSFLFFLILALFDWSLSWLKVSLTFLIVLNSDFPSPFSFLSFLSFHPLFMARLCVRTPRNQTKQQTNKQTNKHISIRQTVDICLHSCCICSQRILSVLLENDAGFRR